MKSQIHTFASKLRSAIVPVTVFSSLFLGSTIALGVAVFAPWLPVVSGLVVIACGFIASAGFGVAVCGTAGIIAEKTSPDNLLAEFKKPELRRPSFADDINASFNQAQTYHMASAPTAPMPQVQPKA